jgi:glucokinase
VQYYLGIDIGGTFIKGVCADEKGNIYAENSIPTDLSGGGFSLCDGIASLCVTLTENVEDSEVVGVGVGCPGIIDTESGTVCFSGNLHLTDFQLQSELQARLNKPVRITNDANAAALGEGKFGAGSIYSDSILVTLGTGVGGGIVIGGKLFEGYKGAGAEIGHMVIVEGGNACTCGRKGCFEAYASATALINMTARAMKNNENSAMWKGYNLDTVCGKTAFDFYEEDETAKKVVDEYIKYLACGLTNLANIFRPQAIILGGGVAAQGERLTFPLQRILDREILGGNGRASVKILTASLANNAGALGAAALFI